MTTAEKQMQLFDDLSLYESSDVEYKGARGGLPRNLWETYSAFANTQGGTIFLGITQRGDELEIHGVESAEKLLADFWNTINNPGKISRNILADKDVQIMPVAATGARVILIDVPRASRRERPIYVGQDPFSGTYRRNFEGDYLCRENEVTAMFADQSNEPADSRILHGFSFEDLDVDSIRQYRNRWASRTPEHAWLGQDDRGLLEKLGAWRRDRQSTEEGITVAGLLMFGRTETITAPEGVPGFHVDYRERFSDDANVRWTDRLTNDGTWEGNVFQFYQRVMVKLSSEPALKIPFQRNNEGYRRTATAVHEALQEALVNALIHGDYRGQGGIVIDRYPDRFEFSNPGTLLVSREQILVGGISECRNKCLQKMFQMLGVGDKAGSGIDKIRKSWAAKNWKSPSLKEIFRPDRVRLDLPLVSMMPEEILGELRTRYGGAIEELDQDEIQTLVVAVSEGHVSNQRLQEMLPLHRVDITKTLKELVRGGFLIAEGAGRGTKYRLEPPFSPPKGGISPPSGTNSPPSDPNSPPSASNPVEDLHLLQIAQRVRDSQRAPPSVVAETVIALCANRYLSLRELAALLGRTPKKLRDDHLTPMVRAGLLELLHPDKPNHRQQAYRARRT